MRNQLKLASIISTSFFLFISKINSQVILDHNNVSAHISPYGTYFNNFMGGIKGYEVPKGIGFSSIFGVQSVFGAKDINDSIYVSMGGYFNNPSDIFQGPISGAYNDGTYINRWNNKVWKICQADIDQYRLWWLCVNGVITSGCDTIQIPLTEVLQTIYDWPAHGELTVGESYWLAPFYDFNSDGIYNPNDGDYPLIKGCCATYMIQNDAAGSHEASMTHDSMGIEVHTMIYQYNTADQINDATFVEITVHNRSSVNYPEFTMGLNVDVDLGNYADDQVGCDSTKNVMYFYNGDINDENFYGIDPPALGVISMVQPMGSFQITSSVNGIGSTREQKYWNMFTGKNIDGSPIVTPSGATTTFQFSGDPSVPTDWTASGIGLPSGDRRGLIMTPIFPLASGQSTTNTYAFVYEHSGNFIENASALINRVPFYINAFQTDLTTQCKDAFLGISENLVSETLFNIFPNPATESITISIPVKSILEKTCLFLDSYGREIKSISLIDNDTTINISDLKPGIYYTEVEGIMKRFVIN
jgi:hypothetical protein